MDQMIISTQFIIIIWTWQEMMVWMRMELTGFLDVIWLDLGLKVGQIAADFCQATTTNRTQHHPHWPDDHPKTIHYHHLDMARDDGMDEHGIDWPLGCHLVGFGLIKVELCAADICNFSTPQL
jgi:hypothetical protein